MTPNELKEQFKKINMSDLSAASVESFIKLMKKSPDYVTKLFIEANAPIGWINYLDEDGLLVAYIL